MMNYLSISVSLMLLGFILSNRCSAVNPFHSRGGYGHSHLAGRDDLVPTPTIDSAGSTVIPCSVTGCVTARPQNSNLPCTYINGTTILAGATDRSWTLICDIDFLAQDIFPFISAGSFEKCLEHCDKYSNDENHALQCVGFVFAPDRIGLENDCYLKSSTNNIVSPSTIHLIGATVILQPSSVSISGNKPIQTSSAGSNKNDKTDLNNLAIKLLGPSINNPSKQYVSHAPSLPVKLTSKLLKPGINTDLITTYPLATDTGSWTQSTVPFDLNLGNLSTIPRLSRDGGKGGNINGTHVFYFCDTSTFGDVEGPLGYMNGFVSSSAAIDVTRKAIHGNALELENPIGQWQDDVGRLRGWIPMTTGEEAFNIALSGDGYRYAVWPESSFIPLNETHSLIYAPIVYVEVDMKSQHAEFTSLGNTLIAVSIDPIYGPHADRIVKQLFTQNEVEWGSLGGLRQWTKSGQWSNDGLVYLFGQAEGGILVARVPATSVTNRSAYTYWNGTGWSSTMPDKSSKAFVVDQPVMDVDIFYVPACRCFMMVYLTPFADNTFYWRRLIADHDIIPPYISGGMEDYVENILRFNWSEPKVLYKPADPAEGYIYAGGCHLGYFGDKDIANGGWSLLISWTEHVVKDPDDPSSGYVHKSIVLQGAE